MQPGCPASSAPSGAPSGTAVARVHASTHGFVGGPQAGRGVVHADHTTTGDHPGEGDDTSAGGAHSESWPPGQVNATVPRQPRLWGRVEAAHNDHDTVQWPIPRHWQPAGPR